MPRLAGIDAQCVTAIADEAVKNAASIAATATAIAETASSASMTTATLDATAAVRHLEECLRGFVMHLSAHLQVARDMSTKNCLTRFKVGDLVSISNSSYRRARIAEDRGLLGPHGARIYRVRIQQRPWPVYIEVREDHLEKINR